VTFFLYGLNSTVPLNIQHFGAHSLSTPIITMKYEKI